LKGVENVTPGYMGGHFEKPTYESVCSGQTGHAEVIKVDFDSSVITLSSLCDVFFTLHDPTTLNRQGADEGTQYRSIIFVDEKKYSDVKILFTNISQLNNFDRPLVTEIVSVNPKDWSGASGNIKKTFWHAENYHKNFFNNNQNNSYCSVVINPKIEKLQKKYSNLTKK
jgi:peptide-methionine (S)-S-oxide reductase